MFNKSFAFTLAEVLITLGIIGVVAALTIPSLIANTTNQRYRSQYKKSLASLAQGIRIFSAQNDYDFANMLDVPIQKGYNSNIEYFFMSSFAGITELEGNGAQSFYNNKLDLITTAYIEKDENYLFTLADGSLIVVCPGIHLCTEPEKGNIASILPACSGFIDVNGPELPNKEVRCSDGTTAVTKDIGSCVVDNKSMGDIFPVVFYDSTVIPMTNAARAVLLNNK